MTVFNNNDDDDDAVVSLTEPFLFLLGASVDGGKLHGQFLKLIYAGSIKIYSVLPSCNTFRTASCIFMAAMASSFAVFNFCPFLSKSKIV